MKTVTLIKHPSFIIQIYNIYMYTLDDLGPRPQWGNDEKIINFRLAPAIHTGLSGKLICN